MSSGKEYVGLPIAMIVVAPALVGVGIIVTAAAATVAAGTVLVGVGKITVSATQAIASEVGCLYNDRKERENAKFKSAEDAKEHIIIKAKEIKKNLERAIEGKKVNYEESDEIISKLNSIIDSRTDESITSLLHFIACSNATLAEVQYKIKEATTKHTSYQYNFDKSPSLITELEIMYIDTSGADFDASATNRANLINKINDKISYIYEALSITSRLQNDANFERKWSGEIGNLFACLHDIEKLMHNMEITVNELESISTQLDEALSRIKNDFEHGLQDDLVFIESYSKYAELLKGFAFIPEPIEKFYAYHSTGELFGNMEQLKSKISEFEKRIPKLLSRAEECRKLYEALGRNDELYRMYAWIDSMIQSGYKVVKDENTNCCIPEELVNLKGLNNTIINGQVLKFIFNYGSNGKSAFFKVPDSDGLDAILVSNEDKIFIRTVDVSDTNVVEEQEKHRMLLEQRVYKYLRDNYFIIVDGNVKVTNKTNEVVKAADYRIDINDSVNDENKNARLLYADEED